MECASIIVTRKYPNNSASWFWSPAKTPYVAGRTGVVAKTIPHSSKRGGVVSVGDPDFVYIYELRLFHAYVGQIYIYLLMVHVFQGICILAEPNVFSATSRPYCRV